MSYASASIVDSDVRTTLACRTSRIRMSRVTASPNACCSENPGVDVSPTWLWATDTSLKPPPTDKSGSGICIVIPPDFCYPDEY